MVMHFCLYDRYVSCYIFSFRTTTPLLAQAAKHARTLIAVARRPRPAGRRLTCSPLAGARLNYAEQRRRPNQPSAGDERAGRRQRTIATQELKTNSS
eukprot:6187502-Pleurochrysis_carterae.AAC.1